MKHQGLFSTKDKCKKLKCRLLQFLFGALRIKIQPQNRTVSINVFQALTAVLDYFSHFCSSLAGELFILFRSFPFFIIAHTTVYQRTPDIAISEVSECLQGHHTRSVFLDLLFVFYEL